MKGIFRHAKKMNVNKNAKVPNLLRFPRSAFDDNVPFLLHIFVKTLCLSALQTVI